MFQSRARRAHELPGSDPCPPVLYPFSGGGSPLSGLGFETLAPAIDSAVQYTAWIVDRLQPFLGPKVLECGLGHANYRAHYRGVTRYTGVDVDPAVVENARRRWPGDEFVCLDLCDPAFAERVGGGFDAALCLNVLQYVADERRAIEHLLGAVRVGGHVGLLLPAHGWLLGPMDRLSKQSRRYDLPRLERLIPHVIAEAVVLDYMNPLGALSWLASNLMPPRGLTDPAAERRIAFYDRYVVPLSRRLDPLTRRRFGLSLLCVLRRRR